MSALVEISSGQADIAAVQAVVRTRVLRWFARHQLLTVESAADMQRWAHGGGFSLHAGVAIDAPDRRGLERPLRYCARPPEASELRDYDRPLPVDYLNRLEPLPGNSVLYPRTLSTRLVRG